MLTRGNNLTEYFTEKAAEHYRAEAKQYGLEMAGSNAIIHSIADNATLKKEEEKKKRQDLLEALQDLVLDLMTPAEILEATKKLDKRYDKLADKGEQMKAQLAKMEKDHEARAIKVGGKRVYKRADGKWVDEEGNVINDEGQELARKREEEMLVLGISAYTYSEFLTLENQRVRVENFFEKLQQIRENLDWLLENPNHPDAQDILEDSEEGIEELEKFDFDPIRGNDINPQQDVFTERGLYPVKVNHKTGKSITDTSTDLTDDVFEGRPNLSIKPNFTQQAEGINPTPDTPLQKPDTPEREPTEPSQPVSDEKIVSATINDFSF